MTNDNAASMVRDMFCRGRLAAEGDGEKRELDAGHGTVVNNGD